MPANALVSLEKTPMSTEFSNWAPARVSRGKGRLQGDSRTAMATLAEKL
jgi:hypothetical protein